MEMNPTFSEKIRLYELEEAISLFPERARILEIGAGSGWQAKLLRQRGFDVSAIDIKESSGLKKAVFPIQVYDGHHIPFPDRSFDVVFSSNVLEHIPHITTFFNEIRRVSKPGGICIHILPTLQWRLLTTLVHYPYYAKYFLSKSIPTRAAKTVPIKVNPGEICGHDPQKSSLNRLLNKISFFLIPKRHGVFGNCLTEMYYFSAHRWVRAFSNAGFKMQGCFSVKLIYSGHKILGPLLPLSVRRLLSYLTGPAGRIYLMVSDSNP
jgi:SAM-dependent methyltransferase